MINRFLIYRLHNFFERYTNTHLSHSIKIDSGKKGKHIVVFGGVHGDEKVGIRLARMLVKRFKKGKLKLKKGSITFILGNPKAFKKRMRLIDTDLNRSFTGGIVEKDSQEYLRAQAIEDYFKKEHVDGVLDLHSVSTGNFKALAIGQKDIFAQKILKDIAIFDTIFSFDDEDFPGNTTTAGRMNEGFGVAVECGNHTKGSAIYSAEKITYMLLHTLGMIDLPKKMHGLQVHTNLDVYTSAGIIKAGTDFKYLVKNPVTDTFVKKGNAIAQTKEYGVQKAKQDCVLFIPTKEQNVKANFFDAGFLAVKEVI